MYIKLTSEDLNQGDLERRDLAVHENTGQIKLHLETDIHVAAVNGA